MTQPDRDTSLPASLLEVLDHGRDGEPRWIRVEARSAAHAAALARRAAAAGRVRGYVALAADAYLRDAAARAGDFAERTLLLIAASAHALAAARLALLRASAAAPRAHVLLTIGGPAALQPRGAATASMAREARAAYGTNDVGRYVENAERAQACARDGRHAAAERMLRESAGALARRGAPGACAAVQGALGRLLLERGRAADADRVFEEAAQRATAARDEHGIVSARLWQAAARVDAGRLNDAEALCRAALMVTSSSSPLSAWARAQLARVLLAQGRPDAGQAGDVSLPPDVRAALGAVTAAFVDGIAVKVALQSGRLFDAGARARAAADAAALAGDPLADAIAGTAHLRLLAETGDLTAVGDAFARVRTAARDAHAPLRLARARLVWHDALRRGGRTREADRELALLHRLAAFAPPRLRQQIARRPAGVAPAQQVVVPTPPASVITLIGLVQQEGDDAEAGRRVLQELVRELRPIRIDLVSCDAGPVTTLASVGSGLPSHLGTRVLEAGITIGPEEQDGGQEIGVPVRLASQLVAGLVARWPADRQPPAHAAHVLELAAAVAAPRIEQQLASARLASAAATAVPELVGVSDAMEAVRRTIVRAAHAPFTVLVEGESGVGKELVARAIHHLGSRRERRFCDVNCAAITEDLLDAELFGHARGAFTGAVADRAGLFEEADGGTLFLDEVADLSPRGQAKLLRVLQQHEVRRVGESFSRKVDVRLVTAANRDMRAEAAAGRFRQDLLYRLDVIRIHIPPLRDRPADIALLAEHFWRAAAARVASSARLTHGVLAALTRHHWPGNVRELQNVMAALAVAAPARGRVQASLLPAAIAGTAAVTSLRLAEARRQFERRCLEVALAQAGGNRTRAAAQLGLSRQGLLKTMARVGIGP